MDAISGTNILPPPPPEGLNYIAAIRPSLNLLMIGTVWSSMLVPILVALLLFSNRALRRKPIFFLNLIAILIGLAEGILSGVVEIIAITSPLTPIHPSAFTAFTCLCLLVPLFVESILIFRLVAVYPPRQQTPWRLAVIFGPPVLFKVVRVVNGIIFIVQWQAAINDLGNPVQAGETLWGTQPWTKIEWFLQLVDNTYTSVLFLLRLNEGKKARSHSLYQTSSSNGSPGSRRASYTSRLTALFWIAVSNFVFPVMLSLAQLIFVFVDDSYLVGGYIFLTNNYVQIIGVILASVWASGVNWVGDDPTSTTTSSGGTLSVPRFASRTVTRTTQSSNTMLRDDGDVIDLGSFSSKEFSGVKRSGDFTTPNV